METQQQNSNLAPEQKIQATRTSLRCFVYSLLGLVPILGIPYSLAALVQSRKARKVAGNAWNPATGYLKAAGRIAPLGFLISAGFVVLVFVILPALVQDLGGCRSGHT